VPAGWTLHLCSSLAFAVTVDCGKLFAYQGKAFPAPGRGNRAKAPLDPGTGGLLPFLTPGDQRI
jgi:hypothetical protein